MTSAIFHIGLPKTGTSAIQSFLAANREVLPFPYPAGPNDDRSAQGKSTPGNGAAMVKLIAQRKQDEAAGLVEDGALYSSERFSGLLTPLFAAYLKRFDSTVVCYVRPQVDGLIAGHGQVTKTEQFTGDLQAFFERRKRRPLLSTRLGPLRKVSSLIVRPYNRKAMVNQDIVDDFFDALGRPVPQGARRFEGVNVGKEKSPIDLALAQAIAAYYRADNDKLDEMFGRAFGLNAANDAFIDALLQKA